jgi:hypothetical protein
MTGQSALRGKGHHLKNPHDINIDSGEFAFDYGAINRQQSVGLRLPSNRHIPISLVKMPHTVGEIQHTEGNRPLGRGCQLPVEHGQEVPRARLETCADAALTGKAPSRKESYEHCRDSWLQYLSFLDLSDVNNYSSLDRLV